MKDITVKKAWAIKDTTNPNYPYIITYYVGDEIYGGIPMFRTKRQALAWIKDNPLGYTWHPVKVAISEP